MVRCGDLIWIGIMLLAFVYFGYHLVSFFQAHLFTLLGALGGLT
jgi:hypothetical protein